MSRKSTIVTLGILGAISAASVCCCCGNITDAEDADNKDEDGQVVEGDNKDKGGGGGHRPHSTRRWVPIVFWGGGGHTFGPSHPTGTGTSSTTSRGGFGATGTAHGGGGIGG